MADEFDAIRLPLDQAEKLLSELHYLAESLVTLPGRQVARHMETALTAVGKAQDITDRADIGWGCRR